MSDICHVAILILLVGSRFRQNNLALPIKAREALVGIRNPQGDEITLEIESASHTVTVATAQRPVNNR